ncbi:MAG: hypothetical protein AAGH89_13185 [Verrucomicrobiota bacterium]
MSQFDSGHTNRSHNAIPCPRREAPLPSLDACPAGRILTIAWEESTYFPGLTIFLMPHHQEDQLPEKNSATNNNRTEEEDLKDDSSNDKKSPPPSQSPMADVLSDNIAQEAIAPDDLSPKDYPTDNSVTPDTISGEDQEPVEEEPPSSQTVDDLAKQHFHSEQAEDLTLPPVSDECELPPRLVYVKVTKRLENGSCEFCFDGEKIVLPRKLSELLEALLLDDGPSEDDFVRFKSAAELTRKLKTNRNSLHNMIRRLRFELSEHFFFLGDPVCSCRIRGYRISLLHRQHLK